MALTPEQRRRLEAFGRSAGQQQSRTQQEEQPSALGSAIGDTARGLGAGALELPSAVTGVADIAAGLAGADRPFSRAAGAVGEATGIQPSAAAESLRQGYSPQMQESQRAVQTAWQEGARAWEEGRPVAAAAGVVSSYLRNPRTIQALVTESLPSAVAGGLIGRGIMSAAGTTRTAATAFTPAQAGARVADRTIPTQAGMRSLVTDTPRISPAAAGAAGQAPVVAGQAMAGIDTEVDAQRAALASLGIGVGSGLIAGLGASAARRAGLVDIESAIAGGRAASLAGGQAQRGVAARVAGGAAAEGVLQELPQEALDQMGRNWAEGEPIFQGVPRAAVEGMLAGGTLGAAVNVRRAPRGTDTTDLTQTITSQEVDRAGEQKTAGFSVKDAEVGSLIRYFRRLGKVASDAVEHPDLQEEALTRMEAVTAELERQGIPRQVLDLEAAKSRFTELQLETDNLRNRYRQALRTDPGQARQYIDKIRNRVQEADRLAAAYSVDELSEPSLTVTRALQGIQGTEKYFRSSRGETTSRLKRRAADKMNELLALDDVELARQIVADQEIVAERGADDLDTWAPMREAVARDRGISEQVTELAAAPEPEAAPAPVETFTTEQISQDPEAEARALAQFDDGPPPPDAEPLPQEPTTQEPTADPASQAVNSMRAATEFIAQGGATAAQQRDWTNLLAVMQDFEAGQSTDSAINSAAERSGVSRQAFTRNVERMMRAAVREAGLEDGPQMSLRSAVDRALSAPIETQFGSQLAAADGEAEFVGDRVITPGGTTTGSGDAQALESNRRLLDREVQAGRMTPEDRDRALQMLDDAYSDRFDELMSRVISRPQDTTTVQDIGTLVENDRERLADTLGYRTSQQQYDDVKNAFNQIVSELESAGDRVQPATMLEIANRLTGGKYSEVVSALLAHPSTQNINFEFQPRDVRAWGTYNDQTHTVWLNTGVLVGTAANRANGYSDTLYDAADAADKMGETIIHEMIHAATARFMSSSPDSMAVQELQDLSQQFNQWAQDAELNEVEQFIADNMRDSPLEFPTYAFTNPVARSLLQRVQVRGEQQGLWSRFLSWVRDILGMENEAANTLLDAVIESSTTIMEMDALRSTVGFDRAADTAVMTVYDRLHAVSAAVDSENADTVANAIIQVSDAFDDYSRARENNEGLDQARAELERKLTDANNLALVMESVVADGRGSELNSAIMPSPDTISRALNRAVSKDYDSVMRTLPANTWKWVKATKNRVRALANPVMFTSDFIDSVETVLPQARAWANTIFHRMSERNDMHVRIQQVIDPVTRWSTAKRDQMNAFVSKTVVSESWPFKPDWVSTTVNVDPALAREYSALPQDTQQVIADMLRESARMMQEMQAQVRGDIVTTFDNLIDKARNDKQRAKRVQEKEAALSEHDARVADNLASPYLPLKRWGKWVVVFKSQRYKDAEASQDRRAMRDLKADADHYRVTFTQTEFQAQLLKDQWQEETGVEIEAPFPRMRMDAQNEVVPFDLLQRLKNEVQQDADDAPTKAINNALDKLYIQALSDTSVRKSELHRMKVEGFDRDMVRSFVEHGQGMASLTSALKINRETRRLISEMKKYARDPKAGKQRRERITALNEILARQAQSLDVEPMNNLQEKVMAGTSIWMLLTSPAYYVQNATQPFMLTYPVLSARFGLNKSMSFMAQGYNDILKAHRSTTDGELLDPKQLVDPQEQALFNRLQRRQLLDVGIAADLGSLADAKSPLGRLGAKAHRRMIKAVRTIELYNRGVTALASYRLRKEQLLGQGRSETQAVEGAMRYAEKIVQTTQGDYSGPNAPRLISMLPAGRLLTQFRKFQLIQIGLLTRTIHQSFRGATPAERVIGRRQAAYILGVHGIIGGAMGLPAANIIGYALAKAFGDDDEPANAELLARRAIGDKDTADLILKGLPARLGVDASARLGMGLTFSVMPFADASISRDGLGVILANILGPSVGLAGQMMDGVNQMQNGNVVLGAAQLLPSVLRNSIRAYMFHTEGIRSRSGDQLMTPEDLTWFDVGTQGMGWPSTTVTDRYMAFGALRDVQNHFRDRTTVIKRVYTEAYDAGDQQGMQAAIDAWLRLQDMRREYRVGQPQPVRNLTRAPLERARREAMAVEGVPTQRTTRGFVEQLFE